MKKAKILAVLIAALLTSVISTPCINAFAVSSLKDFSIITKEPEYFPATNNLEVGLYWFDQYNRVHNSNSPTPYFDKTKPTVIFVHGWAESILKNAGLSDSFPNFQYQPYADPTIDINVLKDWINKGYNVGIFNWKQLADEPIVECAEDKIWTSQHWVGLIPINMRWKKITGYETKNMPNKTSADLFYESYSKAMEGYEGDDIRIVGHSLGNQMAIRLVDLVDKHIENGDIPKELMPDRVALLDPYYSERSKSYLNGNTTADEADKIVRRLIDKQKIVFEMYKSSALTNNNLSGDSNRALEKMCYHADLYPNYFFLMEQREKHCLPIYTYFWQSLYKLNPNTAGIMSTEDNSSLGAMMGGAYYWYQKQGRYTINPQDDTYLPRKIGRYIPQVDINLSYNGKNLTYVDKNNYETINVNVGGYVSLNTQAYPLTATSKIVSFKKESGAMGSVQIATNGIFKALTPGQVLIKVYSRNLDRNGQLGDEIAKYVMINVS